MSLAPPMVAVNVACPTGQCGPNLAAVAEAKGAAAKLIETVMRKPAIDGDSEEGSVLPKVSVCAAVWMLVEAARSGGVPHRRPAGCHAAWGTGKPSRQIR